MATKYLCYSKEEDRLYISDKKRGVCGGSHLDIGNGKSPKLFSFINVDGQKVETRFYSNMGYGYMSYLVADLKIEGENIIDFDPRKINIKNRASLPYMITSPGKLNVSADNHETIIGADWESLFGKIVEAYNNRHIGYIGDIEAYVSKMQEVIDNVIKQGAYTYEEYFNDSRKIQTCAGKNAFLYITEKIIDLCENLNKYAISTYSFFRDNGCEGISTGNHAKLQKPIKKLMDSYMQIFRKYSGDCTLQGDLLKAYVMTCQIGDIKQNWEFYKYDDYLHLVDENDRGQTTDGEDWYDILTLPNRYGVNNKYIYTSTYEHKVFITPLSKEGYSSILTNHETIDEVFMVKRDSDETYSLLSIKWDTDESYSTSLATTNYVEVSGFSHGYARVKDKSGKWGIVNTNCDVIHKCIYDKIFPINDNPIIRVILDGEDDFIPLDWTTDCNTQKQHKGITSISCSNFKKLENLNLTMSSVNFIVGKNNAGKSTFIRLIEKILYFISKGNTSQRLSKYYVSNSKREAFFDSSKDLTFGKSKIEDAIEISICISDVQFAFSLNNGRIRKISVSHNGLTIGYDETNGDKIFSVNYGYVNVGEKVSFKDIVDRGFFTAHSCESYEMIWDVLKKNPDFEFMTANLEYPDYYDELSQEDRRYLYEGQKEFKNEYAVDYAIAHCTFVSSIHVFFADMKEFMMTSYKYKKVIIKTVEKCYRKDDGVTVENIDKDVRQWMSQWLAAMEIGDYISEDFMVYNKGQYVDFKDMGTGSKHFYILLLKIATTLIENIQRPIFLPVLMVEEPEQNLHPMLQSRLADFFLDIVDMQGKLIDKYQPSLPNRDILQIIVETHSEYIIRRTQVLVADKNEFERQKSVREGNEKPFPVEGYDTSYDIEDECPFKVFYFPSECDDDYSCPYEMRFNTDGTFSQSFGRGFFDESMGRYNDIVTIKRQKREME